MTGGLIQIVSFGNQDIMLNGNPEITFLQQYIEDTLILVRILYYQVLTMK